MTTTSKQIKRIEELEEIALAIGHAEEMRWMVVRKALLYRMKQIIIEYCFDYDEEDLVGIERYYTRAESREIDNEPPSLAESGDLFASA